MSFSRYNMVRLIVGLALLVVLLLPTHLIIGSLTLILPDKLSFGIGMLGLALLIFFCTGPVADKLNKR